MTLSGCLELSFPGIAMEKTELEERLFIWTGTAFLPLACRMILTLKLHQGTRKEKTNKLDFEIFKPKTYGNRGLVSRI